MVKLALVDAQRFFREGFKSLAAHRTDLTVVGETGSAGEVDALVESTNPDVVVMEVFLGGASGFETGRRLLRRFPHRRLFFLTTAARREWVAEAVYVGAKGFALKSEASSEVFDAIYHVSQGRDYMTPRIQREEVETLVRHRKATGERGPIESLSPREREVFKLLVHGNGNGAIARQLTISVRTVETHRAHILRKLHQHSLSGMVQTAMDHGLFWQDDFLDSSAITAATAAAAAVAA